MPSRPLRLVLATLALTLAAHAAHAADTKPAASQPPISAVDRSYMNTNVSPCEDFYTYANGAFDKVPIPGEYASYGVNQEVDERNYATLKEILETAAKNGGPAGSVAQRVGDFFAAGMDEAQIERAGLTPLEPWFDKIAALKSSDDLVKLIGEMQNAGFNPAFGFGVKVDDKDSTAMIAGFAQGGIGLPDRDYYFRDDDAAKSIRTAYVAHIAHTFEIAGAKEDSAKSDAEEIMQLETKLAKASRTIVECRDPEKNYNKYDRRKLTKVSPNIGWETFFTEVGFPKTERAILVGQPEFFTALGALLDSEKIEVWRAYLRWHLLRETSPFLGKAFVDESFAFYGTKLSGATELRPRWKRVMRAADAAIGEDLGQLYVQTRFSATAKARALQMVKFHLEAMRNRLRAADWMSPQTKAEAFKKIDAMNTKVGYPDHWRDYSKLQIARRPYVLNVIAANTFEVRRQLDKLGKPVDRSEWQMTPQTNNAYYDPTLNEMCFPAGILQPPFFDEKADDAANYGALASTIGHELTHGFDDEGRQYDARGNLKPWWTPDDVAAFTKRAEVIAQQYEAYEVLPNVHLNGHQTLGENIADNGGLRVSYEAFHLATAGQKLESIDGFTPEQRFFIAFAQSWRTNDRPERIRLQATSDVHSPARWRVLGPVQNFPEFRAAFGCEPTRNAQPAIW
ncbi:MAG TPA: M13 family metallopeptidase [Opitutaceae bacterium]|nr:M13 family metallopeptidase [Opitutaceae bacterium]